MPKTKQEDPQSPDVVALEAPVYALIFSIDDPDILIPIRGIVKSIDFSTGTPLYYIRPTWIYLPASFHKQHVLGRSFICENGRAMKIAAPKRTKLSLENSEIQSLMEKHQFMAYAPFVFGQGNRDKWLERYGMVSMHVVIKSFRKIRDILTNDQFNQSGMPLSGVKHHEDFMTRIGRGFVDLFATQEEYFVFARKYLLNNEHMERLSRDKLV